MGSSLWLNNHMLTLEYRIQRWMKKYQITYEEALHRVQLLDIQYEKARKNKEKLLNRDIPQSTNRRLTIQLDAVSYTTVSTLERNSYTAIGNGIFAKRVLKTPIKKIEYTYCQQTKKWIELDNSSAHDSD